MDQTLNVAFVRDNDRRAAVAGALALLVDDLRALATPSVVLLPADASHAGTLSATLDAVIHAGAIEVVVVETRDRAERLGHRREAFGRPVRFVDPDDAGTHDLLTAIANASCDVALTRVAKTRSAGELLAALARSPRGDGSALPRILIVDAFDARRAAIAGTDATAVATVAAAVLAGAGMPDVARIQIRGDRLDARHGTRPIHLFRARRTAASGADDKMRR